jgi:hypothetical protein
MSTESNSEESKHTAGLAGAGGGTLVSVIANQLPDTNVLKVPLLYCAPSLSIVIALVLVWAQVNTVRLRVKQPRQWRNSTAVVEFHVHYV